MNALRAHPITLTLAIIALVVWTLGNYRKQRLLVIIGMILSAAALVMFFLEKNVF